MGATGSYDDRLEEDKDKARAMLGDTDGAEFLHSDDHINAVITWKGGLNAAVVFLADELIARFAVQPVVQTATGETLNYADRLESWKRLVDRTEQAVAGAGSSSITMVAANYTGASSTDEYARPERWNA